MQLSSYSWLFYLLVSKWVEIKALPSKDRAAMQMDNFYNAMLKTKLKSKMLSYMIEVDKSHNFCFSKIKKKLPIILIIKKIKEYN